MVEQLLQSLTTNINNSMVEKLLQSLTSIGVLVGGQNGAFILTTPQTSTGVLWLGLYGSVSLGVSNTEISE